MMVSSEETIKNLRSEVLFLRIENQKLSRLCEKNNGQDMDETKQDLITHLFQLNESMKQRIDELEEALRQKDDEPAYEPMRIAMKDAECEPKMSSSTLDELLQRSVMLKEKDKREQELLKQIQILQNQLSLLQLQHQQLQFQHEQQQRRNQQEQPKQQYSSGAEHNSHHRPDSNQCSHVAQDKQLYQLNRHVDQTHIIRPLEQHNRYQTDPTPPTREHLTSDERDCLEKLFELDGKLTTARNRLRAVVLN